MGQQSPGSFRQAKASQAFVRWTPGSRSKPTHVSKLYWLVSGSLAACAEFQACFPEKLLNPRLRLRLADGSFCICFGQAALSLQKAKGFSVSENTTAVW